LSTNLVEFSEEELIIIALLLDEEEENKSKTISIKKKNEKELCGFMINGKKEKLKVNLRCIISVSQTCPIRPPFRV